MDGNGGREGPWGEPMHAHLQALLRMVELAGNECDNVLPSDNLLLVTAGQSSLLSTIQSLLYGSQFAFKAITLHMIESGCGESGRISTIHLFVLYQTAR